MDKTNNWESLKPVENTTQETTPVIDWSMEIYNGSEYALTQSVTPNYNTMQFYKH